ncbi:Trm112 family protein [Arthrobacter sp. TMN-37]
MAHVSKQLLEVLRCPVTGAALAEQDGVLVTRPAGSGTPAHTYRLEEGIPVLLASEAQTAATEAAHPGTR